MDAAHMGMYSVAFSHYAVLLSLVSSGVPLVMSSKTAKYRAEGTPHRERNLMSAGLILSITVGAAVWAAVFIFRDALSALFMNNKSIVILIALMPAIFFSGVGNAYKGIIWGQRKYLAVSVIELIEQLSRIIIGVIALFFITEYGKRAEAAAYSLSAACFISSVIYALKYRSGSGPLASAKNELVPLFVASAPITVMRIFSAVINSLIAIILPLRLTAAGYTQTEAMAAFGACVGMSFSLLFIPLTITGSLSMALVPELSEAMEKRNVESLRKQIQSAIKFSVIIASLIIPVFIANGRELGIAIFDNADAGEFLVKSAVIMIPLSVEQITSSMMNSLSLERKAFFNFLAGIILLAASLWFLPKYIGVDSLIVGMGLSMTLSSVLHIVSIKKRIGLPLTFLKPFAFSLLIAIIAGAAGILVRSIIISFMPATAAAYLGGGITLTFSFLMFVVFDLVDLSIVLPKARKKLPSGKPTGK